METLICYCKEVSKREIEIAIEQGAQTLLQIQEKTGACTGSECRIKNPSGKCCSKDILRLIKVKQQLNVECSCCK